jgi:uncharacterized protein (DUF362 family)
MGRRLHHAYVAGQQSRVHRSPDQVGTTTDQSDDGRRVGIYLSSLRAYDPPGVEAAVRAVLLQLGLGASPEEEARGPLASLVTPGDTVLLKPNMVRDCAPDRWDCVITHGEVVRAVALLAAQALQSSGRLVIADGPIPGSDFAGIAAAMRLGQIQTEVRERFGIDVEIVDLCEEDWVERDGATRQRGWLPGDPLGYLAFDLSDRSEFSAYKACDRLYSRFDNVEVTRSAHAGGRHVYRLARTPIAADVFINLPKMKTHAKTGVTLSLKNVVGIHGNRDYLPHHTIGPPSRGGDESPEPSPRSTLRAYLARWLKRHAVKRGGAVAQGTRLLRQAGHIVLGRIAGGNWYRNDTAWRMVLDINKILFYGRPDGSFVSVPRKRYLAIVDGIIAGERDGPQHPTPKPAGLLVAGFNPVAVDATCATIMGFDPARIKMISEAWHATGIALAGFGPADVRCRSNFAEWNGSLEALLRAPHCGFKAHHGWRGQIERASEDGAGLPAQ